MVELIVAGKKMPEEDACFILEQQKLPSEESHPVTHPLGKKHKKSCEGTEERFNPTQSNAIIINIIF